MSNDLIELPTSAFILGLLPREYITPADWQRHRSERRGPIAVLRSGLAQPSFWTERQIRDGFDVANRIWARADIRFSLDRVERRSEFVPADAFDLHTELGNRYALMRGSAVYAGFVHALGRSHGGIAGGRLALVADVGARGASDEWRGTIIAHELGHVLDRPDRVGPRDGNLMFWTVNPSHLPPQDLSDIQIDMSRARARQILEQVRRLAR